MTHPNPNPGALGPAPEPKPEKVKVKLTRKSRGRELGQVIEVSPKEAKRLVRDHLAKPAN